MEAAEAFDQQHAARQQHQGQRHFRRDQAPAQGPAAAARGAAPAVLERVGHVRERQLERWRETHQQARHEREPRREREPGAVDPHLVQPRRVGRGHGHEHVHAPDARHQARDTAGHGHDQALGHELTQHPPPAGAQGDARRQFAAAARGPRHQQVGDVGAGHEQHERHGTGQGKQRRPDPSRDALAQGLHQDAGLRVVVGMLRFEPTRQVTGRALRQCEGDAVGQPRYRAQHHRATGRRGGVQPQRPPHVGIGGDDWTESRRQHADDLVRFARQHGHAPNRRWLGAEAAPPQPVADDRDAARVGHAVAGHEVAAERRRAAEHRQVLVRHLLAGERFGLGVAAERRTPAAHRRHALDLRELRAPIHDVARRSPFVGRATAGPQVLPQHHQAIGAWIRQRPQHQRVDDGEDGGVGADAQRQREDGDGREPGRPQQRPDGVAQILQGRLHRVLRARAEAGSGHQHDTHLRLFTAPSFSSRAIVSG